MPGKNARRLFASAAVLLLIAQSAIVGSSAWCMNGGSNTDENAVVQMEHSGGQHASSEVSGTSDDEHSHHGSDADSACPMMALCTLSAPASFGGFAQTAAVTIASPETTGWSLHVDVPAHTPPPPRV